MTMHDDGMKEPRSERRPRSVRHELDDLAGEDFGLVCHACGTVTIFSPGAGHPRCCARCADDLSRRGRPRADEDRVSAPPASA